MHADGLHWPETRRSARQMGIPVEKTWKPKKRGTYLGRKKKRQEGRYFLLLAGVLESGKRLYGHALFEACKLAEDLGRNFYLEEEWASVTASSKKEGERVTVLTPDAVPEETLNELEKVPGGRPVDPPPPEEGPHPFSDTQLYDLWALPPLG